MCTSDDLTVMDDLTVWGTKSAAMETAEHGARLVYSIESPEVWLEDFGTAALAEGRATVAIEPVFLETIDAAGADYHVFVTPLSDGPVLLFVTDKTPTDFTVAGVTLDGGLAGCSFDYRIVAKRLGYADVRLAQATEWDNKR